MAPLDPSSDRVPSALWLWGFWAFTAAAVAAFVLSLYTPAPVEHILRGVAGGFLIFGGIHQQRVVAYKCATRPAYSTFGPDSYALQRQTGWTAMVVGAVFIGSALMGV